MTREEVAVLIQKALKEGPFSMRQLAEGEGMSYGTLRGWASGNRHPEPDNIRKIADGFEHRAEMLKELAEQLRRAAEAA